MMAVYGSTVVDALPDDFDDAIRMRDEFLESNAFAWSPMQFSNPENIECHMFETAPEIAKQAGPGWVAFIHGSGTGGTIEGVRRFIASEGLGVEVHMVVPKEQPHGIQGIGDGRDFLADPQRVDGIIHITTTEAIQRAESFARETGILVGISAGANILASERWVQSRDPAGIVVTILCDRGERYMSIFGKD